HRDIEIHRLFGVGIEPKKRRDFLHGVTRKFSRMERSCITRGKAGGQPRRQANMTPRANKKPRTISRPGLLECHVKAFSRSWQAWRRPTLPRVDTQYHRRWGL